MRDYLGLVEESLAATAHPRRRTADRGVPASHRGLAASGSGPCSCCWPLSSATRSDPRVIEAAVAIELTHLATLYPRRRHGRGPVRRGHPSVNSRWSNSVAILTGDFLFAQASQILAGLGPDAVRIQAETFSLLVTGQMAETIGPRPGQDPLDFYMHVITEKTGSLIATARTGSARCSPAPRPRSPTRSPRPASRSAWPGSCPTT